MDDITAQHERAENHIWLRYSTQFTQNGRTRTVEMSIPVPPGASSEQREQLLREADAGMQQLSTHVEQFVSRIQQQSNDRRSEGAPSRPQPVQKTPPPRPATPASTDLAQSIDEPIAQAQKSVMTMSTTTPLVGTNGTIPLTIPQFIQLIQEHLNGMSAKQAMDRLRVKTLTGINLREAFATLQQQLQNEEQVSSQPTQDIPVTPQANGRSYEQEPMNQHRQEPAIPIIEELPPARTAYFDEEIELDDEVLEDMEESQGLSNQARERARDHIQKLREVRGTTTASDSRIRVLHILVDEEIGEAKLNTLIERLWSVSTPKRLKVDQAESIISWAKNEDNFTEEVEAVLQLLQEGI